MRLILLPQPAVASVDPDSAARLLPAPTWPAYKVPKHITRGRGLPAHRRGQGAEACAAQPIFAESRS
jgi:hypothetical protein